VLPELGTPVETRDLYSMPACAWGHVPNHLASPPHGDTRTLPVGPLRRTRSLTAAGWAFDASADRQVGRVLLTVDGKVVAASGLLSERPDVAAATDNPAAALSGFSFGLHAVPSGDVRIFALADDGLAHPVGVTVPDLPEELLLEGGGTVDVSSAPISGWVDYVTSEPERSATVDVPDGVDLQDYDLATFTSQSGAIGRSEVRLLGTNSTSVGLSSEISLETLPRSGRSVAVRVGACLQWHGYQGRRLTLLQEGGRPITEIRLSGVAQD
jgi:hypothetical protein